MKTINNTNTKSPIKINKKLIFNKNMSKIKKEKFALIKALKQEKRKVKKLTDEKQILERTLTALQERVKINQTTIDSFGAYLQETFRVFQEKYDEIHNLNKTCTNLIDVYQKTTPALISENNFMKRKSTPNPNRLIVQPMIGGYTIQRPFIHLPRINFRSNNHGMSSRISSSSTTLQTNINGLENRLIPVVQLETHMFGEMPSSTTNNTDSVETRISGNSDTDEVSSETYTSDTDYRSSNSDLIVDNDV